MALLEDAVELQLQPVLEDIAWNASLPEMLNKLATWPGGVGGASPPGGASLVSPDWSWQPELLKMLAVRAGVEELRAQIWRSLLFLWCLDSRGCGYFADS